MPMRERDKRRIHRLAQGIGNSYREMVIIVDEMYLQRAILVQGEVHFFRYQVGEEVMPDGQVPQIGIEGVYCVQQDTIGGAVEVLRAAAAHPLVEDFLGFLVCDFEEVSVFALFFEKRCGCLCGNGGGLPDAKAHAQYD